MVAWLGRRLGVTRVWADRLVPLGRGSGLETLTPDETREFVRLMRASRKEAESGRFLRTEVSMRRALQFSPGGDCCYSCTAGDSLLTLLPDGTLFPCRRLPIPCGNVLEARMRGLYYADATLRSLRDPRRVAAGCEHCEHENGCRGGLRCLAYAVHGTPFKADPGCWCQAHTAELSRCC